MLVDIENREVAGVHPKNQIVLLTPKIRRTMYRDDEMFIKLAIMLNRVFVNGETRAMIFAVKKEKLCSQ